MNRFNAVILVGVMSLLALAGCSQTEPPTAASSSPVAASASPVATTSPNTTQSVSASPAVTGKFGELAAVVTKTQASVDAGNFAQAKTEFAKFEDAWSKVEDGVKAKSSQIYDEIEENADTVTKELKAAKPDAAKTTAALKTLAKDVALAAKS